MWLLLPIAGPTGLFNSLAVLGSSLMRFRPRNKICAKKIKFSDTVTVLLVPNVTGGYGKGGASLFVRYFPGHKARIFSSSLLMRCSAL